MRRLFGLMAGMLLMINGAAAQQVPPDELVKTVTGEVLNSVNRAPEIRNGNTAKAVSLVETKVLPYFDFQRMTALAVGKAWRQASAEQKAVLTSEFRTLLVRTYSNALTAYKNQTIVTKPLKVSDDATEVMVRTQIRQPGAQSIAIDYALEKKDASWKVYDVVVGGISLVTSYRDQFAPQLRSDGIDGLIKTLHGKNGSKVVDVAKQ